MSTTDIVWPENLRRWVESVCLERFPDTQATLLAEADDGYVWGAWTGTALALNEDIDGLKCARRLRSVTLHWLRVFSPLGEVRAWRHGKSLRTRFDGGESTDATGTLAIERAYALVGSLNAASSRLPGHRTVLTHPVHGVSFTVLRGVALETHAPPGDWGRDQQPWLVTRDLHLRDPPSGQWLLESTRFVELTGEKPSCL